MARALALAPARPVPSGLHDPFHCAIMEHGTPPAVAKVPAAKRWALRWLGYWRMALTGPSVPAPRGAQPLMSNWAMLLDLRPPAWVKVPPAMSELWVMMMVPVT